MGTHCLDEEHTSISIESVGLSVFTLSNSGSSYPLTASRALAFLPSLDVGSSFQVNIQRELIIREGWILFRRSVFTVWVSIANILFLSSWLSEIGFSLHRLNDCR